MCVTYNCDYLKHSTFRFNLIDIQLNADINFEIFSEPYEQFTPFPQVHNVYSK